MKTPLTMDEQTMLAQNIGYLLRELPHGEHTKLAKRIGVHPTTITHWANGDSIPSAQNRQEFLWGLGLPGNFDLLHQSVRDTRGRLIIVPIATRRRWLLLTIEKLDDNALDAVWPELSALLSEKLKEEEGRYATE